MQSPVSAQVLKTSTTTQNILGMNKNYFKEANYDKYQKSTNNLAKTYIVLAVAIMILGNMKMKKLIKKLCQW